MSQTKPAILGKVRSRKFDSAQFENHTLMKETPYKGITGKGWTADELKLAMWNVNGIRSVMNKKNLYSFIKKYTPDIFCLNETKINKDMFEKSPINFEGYNGYWNFCKISAGYSGVAVFSKFLPLSIFEDLQLAQFSQQGRVLTLQFQKFYLVAVYIPCAGGKQLQRLSYKVGHYMVAFESYCQNLKKKGKGVIVCGDMNVACEEIDIYWTANSHKQPGYTFQERKCFKKFLAKGWVDTYRKLNPTGKEYTWWRIEYGCREKNIGKRLDYFIVNESFMNVVKKSKILGDVMGSDHCPVYIEVDLSSIKTQKKEQTEDKKEGEEQCKSQTKNEAEGKNEQQRDIRERVEMRSSDLKQTQQNTKEVQKMKLY